MKKLLSLLMVMVLVVGCGQSTDEAVYDTTEANEPAVAETDTTEADTAVTEDAGSADEASTDENSTEEAVETVEIEPVDIKVIAPYGTPVLSMVKMFVDNPEIAEGVTIEYEAIQATDVLTAELVNKNADIAIIPTNLAAVLHSKGTGYKVAGSSVGGVLYVAASSEFESIEDLKGQTIGAFGQNLTPDAVLKYVLIENGVDVEADVTLDYFSGASETASNYIAGQYEVAMLPQPVLTNVLMKRDDTTVVFDLQEEWTELTGIEFFPQASVVVSEELIASHPEVVKAFLTELDASVDWVNENAAEAGTYYESLDIGLNAMVVEKALPACNLDFVYYSDAKEAFTTYLDVLFNFNPNLTGGAQVDETLFFEK